MGEFITQKQAESDRHELMEVLMKNWLAPMSGKLDDLLRSNAEQVGNSKHIDNTLMEIKKELERKADKEIVDTKLSFFWRVLAWMTMIYTVTCIGFISFMTFMYFKTDRIENVTWEISKTLATFEAVANK